eukprot:CAMPEP_0117531164 /NCGR_PEP_ID=MMETSP0784-20121206/38719_1 /TAXON_ID=39447 /ORGANISM="" /LENGTH=157 /DNA_ID=CAMNT_0005327533 /DNA_START=188 /DNA_END=658 /DNA_ORIENTATION=-
MVGLPVASSALQPHCSSSPARPHWRAWCNARRPAIWFLDMPIVLKGIDSLLLDACDLCSCNRSPRPLTWFGVKPKVVHRTVGCVELGGSLELVEGLEAKSANVAAVVASDAAVPGRFISNSVPKPPLEPKRWFSYAAAVCIVHTKTCPVKPASESCD